MTYREKYLQGSEDKLICKQAHIISRMNNLNGPKGTYFEIEYVMADELDVVYYGFGSYYLDLVMTWLNEEFILPADSDDKKNVLGGIEL